MKDFAKQIHEGNAQRGFWETPNSLEKCALLAISELAEALEADRKNRYCDPSDKAAYLAGEKTFVEAIKDTVEDELADAVIRIYDYSYYYKLNLDAPIDIVEARSYLPSNFYKALFDIITQHFRAKYKKSPIFLIGLIYAIAKDKWIDLDWHIQEKLKYNASRPYKHGKQY